MSRREDTEAPHAGPDRHLQPRGPRAEETRDRKGARQDYSDPVDATLDDSFPASDPPAWAGA